MKQNEKNMKTMQPQNQFARIAIVSLLLGMWLSACEPQTGADSEAEGNPNVVSTSTIITDWTEQIGGDEINLTSILKPGDDPHVYEPVPTDTVALEEADLILYNGYDLEPALIRLINATGGDAELLAVGEVVTPLETQKEGETVPDPHVWGSAENAIAMVNAIRDALIELSPDDQAEFSDNAAQLVQDLEQLHTWIGEQIATIPSDQRQLITTHDAFEYYARAYGLDVIGTLIGISTEEQPSAQTVQTLVESVQAAQVPAIFAETTINPRLITTVAEEAGVELAPTQLYSDSIGAPGSEADSYLKMMQSNTRAIVEALGGEYTPLESGE
jgi:manganese/iron transport system substrate-binding protein